MKKYKEVMFDFDGTIADTVDSIISFIREKKDDFDLEIPEITDEVVINFKNMEPEELLQYVGLSKFEMLKFIKKYQDYIVLDISKLKMIGGMDELLDQVSKEHTLGILSSNSENVIIPFLEHYDLKCFQFMEAGATLWSKETRLKKVLKVRKLDVSEIVYVGDEVKDVEAAKSVGMDVISVDWGYNSHAKLQEYNPDRVVSNPEDILNYL